MRELLYNNGYNIVGSADNGYDAIELCKKTKPDFVILDVKMPIVNGIAAAKIISKEELAGFVLLLTAYKDKTIVCLVVKYKNI